MASTNNIPVDEFVIPISKTPRSIHISLSELNRSIVKIKKLKNKKTNIFSGWNIFAKEVPGKFIVIESNG